MEFKKSSAVITAFLVLTSIIAMQPNAIGASQSFQSIPSSGVIQLAPNVAYCYNITFLDQNYIIINRNTETIDFQSPNATQVINYAIGKLNQSGSILFNPAIYYLNGSITAVGLDNIELYFENGAELYVGDGMNAPAIKLTAVNNWTIKNPTINGNRENQPSAAGDVDEEFQHQIGIYIGHSSNNNIIEDAKITNCGTYGIFFVGVEGDEYNSGFSTGNIVRNSIITDCGWNGICSCGYYFIDNTFINNTISYCSDFGISTFGQNNIIKDNHIFNIKETIGWDNAQCGIGVEGGNDNIIENNTIENCFKGVSFSTFGKKEFGDANKNIFINNEINNCNIGVFIMSNDNLIQGNVIRSPINAIAYGVLVYDGGINNSANNLIISNTFHQNNPLQTFDAIVTIDSLGYNTIFDNDFTNCLVVAGQTIQTRATDNVYNNSNYSDTTILYYDGFEKGVFDSSEYLFNYNGRYLFDYYSKTGTPYIESTVKNNGDYSICFTGNECFIRKNLDETLINVTFYINFDTLPPLNGMAEFFALRTDKGLLLADLSIFNVEGAYFFILTANLDGELIYWVDTQRILFDKKVWYEINFVGLIDEKGFYKIELNNETTLTINGDTALGNIKMLELGIIWSDKFSPKLYVDDIHFYK